MKKPEVTVVGSFAVGLTMRAPKLPIFGETMLGTDFDLGPGGKGSNQAVATARLGAHSALLALIGTDKLDPAVYKSARNIAGVTVLPAAEFNAYAVLRPKRLVLTRAALDVLKSKKG